uniref:Leucine-rich repeat-containing N-terminal plant-type domain-containing protein n=1 Tax=Leersia perrieri TaxID=77586 RepID=A0A0D9WAC1_9ORYZ
MQGLYLQNNNFSGEIPACVFTDFPKLWILRASNNQLGVWCLVLDLSGNHITGNIPQMICSLASIEILDISNNNLTGPIPRCNSASLASLNLYGNSLSGDISDDLFNTSNLMYFDMRHNKLTGNLSWLGHLDNIKTISLGWNGFEGQITPDLCKLKCPRIIDFSHNKLSGSLPPCVGNISCESDTAQNPSLFLLFYIIIEAYISVYDPIDFTFTTKGGQYTYGLNFFNLMSGIDLSGNMLSGEIPWELGNLSHIKSVNLSNNFFTGQIPASFANMSEIESLDLSNNLLSGSIPWQLTRLSSLAVFSVAYNNLSGCIPNSGQFGSFSMDSYQGNNNLHNMSEGNKCSPGNKGAGNLPSEGRDSMTDDPVLYAVSAASFVLASWATVAFLFFHPLGRSVILASGNMVLWSGH